MKKLLERVLGNGKFWTDAWSLVEGCTPVSPGCANCWLSSMARRFTPVIVNPGNGQFNGIIKCHEERLDLPLRAKKSRVYAIWSDLFHEAVPVDFLNRAFDTMNRAKHHRFIIITKRPERAADYLRSWPQWPPMPNVIIMVTMEDQERANERAPEAMSLASIGWNVGALCEPLLGPVDLDRIYTHGETEGGGSWGSWDSCISGKRLDVWSDGEVDAPKLLWIITGGESGHGARPVHPDWIRSLRDQAQAASVPFMFKQWGDGKMWNREHYDDLLSAGYSGAGKKHGRTIDGREWREVP
jgi:protein gp37